MDIIQSPHFLGFIISLGLILVAMWSYIVDAFTSVINILRNKNDSEDYLQEYDDYAKDVDAITPINLVTKIERGGFLPNHTVDREYLLHGIPVIGPTRTEKLKIHKDLTSDTLSIQTIKGLIHFDRNASLFNFKD